MRRMYEWRRHCAWARKFQISRIYKISNFSKLLRFLLSHNKRGGPCCIIIVMVSLIHIVFLLCAIPCLLGQQFRVAVIQEEPMFFQLPNVSFAGIAHDTFQGVLQVLQNKFNRTITPEYIFTHTVEDLANLIVSNQAGLFYPLPSRPSSSI